MAETAITFRQWLRGLRGAAEDSTGQVKRLVDDLFKFTRTWEKDAADAMAADTTAERQFWVADRICRVTAVSYTPNAAVTANGTNFFSILVAKRLAASPTTTVNVSTRSLAATNMVQYDEDLATVTSTAADALLAVGDVLSVAITKAASGLVCPAGLLQVYLEEV